MNVNSLGDGAAYLSPFAGTAPNQAVGNRAGADGDSDGARHVSGAHHHRDGGRMGQAVVDALQQLGMGAPSGTSAASPSASAGGRGTDPDGDGDGSSPGAAAVLEDMHTFMHALFDAVRSEGSNAGTSTNGSPDANGVSGFADNARATSDRRAGFAAKLSELVSQVGGGNAPPDLQASFDKLMSDLQGGTAAATSPSGTPSLTQLLTTMQQQLGYAGTTASNAVGNGLNATA